MAAALDVGVRELVDEHDLRSAGEDGVEVHFLEQHAAILERALGDELEAVQQGLRLGAAVRLHDATTTSAP